MPELGFIHRYVRGADPQPAKRVLLLLHGTGGDENDLLPLGREVDPEAALLSPRGKVSEHGHLRFFRRLAEGVFDEEDVVRRAHELADFIVVAAAAYQFEPRELIAVGYSNGANIAAALLLLRPEVIGGGVLLRAMVPLSSAVVPDLTGRRVLISVGELDRIVPADQGRRLAERLRTGGADVTLTVQPGAAHGLAPGDLAAARDWL